MAEWDRSLLVFHAEVATSAREIRLRLADHIGEAGASLSRIRKGIDMTDIVVCSMVTPSLRHMLSKVERAPLSPLAAGLYVHLVQTLGIEE